MHGWQISQMWRALGRRARGAMAAAALALALVGAAGAARASDKVYTVANYPVEAVAQDAVAAKRKALADGQQAAFRSLLRRLMPVTTYAKAKQLASMQAVDLIDSFRVRSERNSPTQYIATYDFTFRAKEIRDLLRREGVPFTDEQAPVTVVIPVWQGGTPKDQAGWTANWKSLDLEYSLTPVKLESLRKDIAPDLVAAVAAGDIGARRTLAAQYKVERVLVALAGADAATGRLAVTLAGTDAVGPFILARQYRVDPADPGYARELAAVVALRIVEGRWKAVHTRGPGMGAGADTVTAPVGGKATDLLIAVEFRGMGEWQDISRKLSATPGVEELDVAGLSGRGARVTLRFAGGVELLADELATQGLSLRNNGGTWVLSLSR
jgi:Uncharacterized protein conserved in bacteria (DUF2066)